MKSLNPISNIFCLVCIFHFRSHNIHHLSFQQLLGSLVQPARLGLNHRTHIQLHQTISFLQRNQIIWIFLDVFAPFWMNDNRNKALDLDIVNKLVQILVFSCTWKLQQNISGIINRTNQIIVKIFHHLRITAHQITRQHLKINLLVIKLIINPVDKKLFFIRCQNPTIRRNLRCTHNLLVTKSCIFNCSRNSLIHIARTILHVRHYLAININHLLTQKFLRNKTYLTIKINLNPSSTIVILSFFDNLKLIILL